MRYVVRTLSSTPSIVSREVTTSTVCNCVHSEQRDKYCHGWIIFKLRDWIFFWYFWLLVGSDWNKLFGACIDNFMANWCTLQNVMSLFISDTTIKYIKNKSNILCYLLATMIHWKFILDFFQFDLAHTGENIDKLLMDSHIRVECDTYFIVSHAVDGAGNEDKYIEVLWLITIYERSGMILSEKCDAHQKNMNEKKASGTTSQKLSINHLTIIHTYLVRLRGSWTRMKLYEKVRKERLRKSSPVLTTSVRTRRSSDNIKISRASDNQSGLEIALRQMIYPTGIDSDLYKYHWKNIGLVLP